MNKVVICHKYEQYKDSGIEWIGEIPQDWNIVTLKRVFSDRCGGAWGEDVKHNEFDRICIRIADFDYPKMSIKKDVEYTKRNYTPDVIAKLTLQNNDILIEKSGGGEQTPVGRTIIFNENFEALYANFMDRLRVRTNNVPKFIQYTLNSFYQNGITYQYIKQTTGIQNLDLTNLLAKEYIALPSKVEQQQISDYLDKKCGEIDRVVETQKDIIEKLKEYKQSVITEAVTKGLDKFAPLKDSSIEWIGKIPKTWEVYKLKHCVIFNPTYSENLAKNTPVSFAPMECLTNCNLDCKETTIEKVSGSYTYFAEEDVIMAKVTPCFENGNIAIAKNLLNKVGFGTSELYVFRARNINNKFLLYFLQNRKFKDLAISTMYGTGGLKRVSADFVKNYKFGLPKVNEQMEISDYLDKKCFEIDSAISDKEQLIEKLTEYKKSLIYECVTGKRKVVS